MRSVSPASEIRLQMTCVTLEPTPHRASKLRGIASSRRALPQRSANCEASTGSLRPECAETPQEASTRRWPPLSICCCGRRDWPLYSASLQGGMAVTLHGLCGYAKGALPPWPKWKSLNSVTALFNRSSPAQTCGGGPARLMRSASPLSSWDMTAARRSWRPTLASTPVRLCMWMPARSSLRGQDWPLT